MLVLQKDLERFWNKVSKTDTCWLWIGAKCKGYGVFRFGQKRYSSHIISYQLHNENYDSSKCICHKCDNPSCVNPSHLFLGTYKDNIQDCINKGRFKLAPRRKGENINTSVLTEMQIIDIKTRLKQGEKVRSIHTDYRDIASEQTLWSIKQNRSWKHVIV